MIENNSESIEEGAIVNELIAERSMSRQVAEYAHSFDLDLFILCCQDVELDAVEDGCPNFSR